MYIVLYVDVRTSMFHKICLLILIAQKRPEFVGLKFVNENKTALVQTKHIKSGTLQVGAEVVVNFNGKSEDARIAVLSGECTDFTFR